MSVCGAAESIWTDSHFPKIPRRRSGREWSLFRVRIRILVKKLTAVEAKDHIGEQATVCGKVAGTRYAVTTRRKPTFLDLDKPYPSQIFTVLIWGENREKFGAPEENYRDEQVCVMGKITEYRGAPEIVVSNPQNIKAQK
jgi:hypothetical protein